MSFLPVLKPKKVIRILKKIGFELIRKKGSHYFLRHADGRTTVVPVHRGEDIKKGLLRAILNDIEMMPKEFLDLIKKKHAK